MTRDRDLIAELLRGVLSPEKAGLTADELIDEWHRMPEDGMALREFLGLSHFEYTAFAHGIPLVDLADWRSGGWPTECARCGGAILLDRSGWLASHTDGTSKLTHLDCAGQLFAVPDS